MKPAVLVLQPLAPARQAEMEETFEVHRLDLGAPPLEVAERIEAVVTDGHRGLTAELIGMLPRLPNEVPAVYRDNSKGPEVRVTWPAPTDNSAVLQPGAYVVTGTVPGTAFEPKANVIVKVPVGTTTQPARSAPHTATGYCGTLGIMMATRSPGLRPRPCR